MSVEAAKDILKAYIRRVEGRKARGERPAPTEYFADLERRTDLKKNSLKEVLEAIRVFEGDMEAGRVPVDDTDPRSLQAQLHGVATVEERFAAVDAVVDDLLSGRIPVASLDNWGRHLTGMKVLIDRKRFKEGLSASGRDSARRPESAQAGPGCLLCVVGCVVLGRMLVWAVTCFSM
jgi:hypothetical protein